MAATAKVNYTPAQTAAMIADYQADHSVESIAEWMGKAVRSVRSKLVREGVYVAAEKAVKSKREDGPTKKELMRDLEAIAPFEVEGFMNATKEAIQSLPLYIQGEHADHDGPGNKTSIGIEISEFRDPRRQAAAIDRAARLTAYVMHESGIPIDHVMPHYHWPQVHFHNTQKNCPRILLEHGRPGPRWDAFLRRVQSHY